MEKPNKNIEILTGSFFPAWVSALAFVLVVGSISAVVYQELYMHQIGAFLFLAGSIIISIIVGSSKKFFEFNPNTRQCRNGLYLFDFKYSLHLFDFKLGKWKPLEIKRAYIAFQRYNENVHFSYGGLFKRDVEDVVFELRIYSDSTTFRTLVSGRDFQSVAMMLQLGKILSLIYNVEFKDLVKGVVRKEMKKEQLNSKPQLSDQWDERHKT